MNEEERKGQKPKIEDTGYKSEFYAILSAILGDYMTLEYVLSQYKEWKAYKTLQEFENFFIKWINGEIPENYV